MSIIDGDSQGSMGLSTILIDSNETEPRTSHGIDSSHFEESDKVKCTPILDGTFFKVIETNSVDGSVVASCVKCEPKHVIIKGNRFSSSNYISHLKRKHGPEVFEEYESYMIQKRKKRSSTASSVSLESVNTKNITQTEFENNIIQFIIHSMCPLRVIEDNYFIKMFTDLDIEAKGLQVLSRRSLVRRIGDMYETMISELKDQLRETCYVCTTADIWSGKRRSFFGVTAHWISLDLKRKSAALACRRFRNTHSYDRIANLLSDIHSEFGINSNKIVATITDNGSNFVKAFKVFGVKIDGFLKDYSGMESDTDSDCQEEETQSNILKENYLGIFQALPFHLRCSAHTLSLCASADLEKTMKGTPDLQSIHHKVLKKCSKLWKAASRPKTAEILEGILGHTLSRPGVTRWNSLYDSLKQIQECREKYYELARALSLKDVLKENEFLYISEHLECSHALAQAIDILQEEKNAYYGMLIPTLLSLRRKLEMLLQKEMTYGKPIAKSFLSSISSRFNDFFLFTSEESKRAAIAALCHPKFKRKWLVCVDSSRHEELLSLLKDSVIDEINIRCEIQPRETDLSEQTSSADDFFDFGANNATTNFSVVTRAELEVLQFFENPGEDLNILNDYKYLKRVFIKYNTPLPSSASVERLFSFASMTNLPKSHRLSDEQFEKRVVLKALLNDKVITHL